MIERQDHNRADDRPKDWLHFRIHVGEQLVKSHFNRYQAGLIFLLLGSAISLLVWGMSF